MPCEGFKKCLRASECKLQSADNDCLEIIHSLKSLKDPRAKSIYQFDPEGNNVRLYHVDEHVITQKVDGEASKCDYLLAMDKEDIKSLVFLELKGKNVDKAIDQILSTIKILKPHFNKYMPKYYGRVVCTKSPTTIKIKNLRKIQNKLDELNGHHNQEYFKHGSRLRNGERYSDFCNDSVK